MTFALYVGGFLIFIGGVAWALIAAGIRPLYVTITCVILIGIGILTGATRTRARDRSA